MRKIRNSLTLCVMVLCLLLNACSADGKIDPQKLKIDKSYKFTADIQYGEFNATALFVRTNTEQWEITLFEPYALEGMSLTYDNGKTTATFEGLEFSFNENASETTGVYEAFIEAFESAISFEGREAISAGEIITITAKSGLYELTFDKKSLEPIALKIPGSSIEAVFSDVVVSPLVTAGNQPAEMPGILIPLD
ncbi:MAG: hypothetical protein FWG83_02350 [Oscillospiraceae bacterium]|nr:hypothetical protein [Oscillospiraceae bacterium]